MKDDLESIAGGRSHSFELGECYPIRTVTMDYTGRVMHQHRVTETYSDSRQRRFKVACSCDMDVILNDWRIPPRLERPKDGPWAGLCVLDVQATHSKGGWVVLVRYGKPPQAMARKRDRVAT